MHCQKCSGEGRVMVSEEDGHWFWEACPDCNGFDDMERVASMGYSLDSFGSAHPYVWCATEPDDDLPL